MSILRLLVLTAASIAIGLICLPNTVLAVEPADAAAFDTELTTIYDVDSSGTTTIVHSFSITNTTATTFLTQYGVRIHATAISEVSAKNNGSAITPNILTEGNITTVSLNFPDEVVGEGKKRNFTIQYSTTDVAAVAGQVLDVHVPPIANASAYSKHTIIVRTPLQFGRATRVSPEPSSVTIAEKTIVTTFEQPGTNSITAFFGEEQYYTMTLRYNLENGSTNPRITQIALPPDTSYQRIHIYSLDPPPQDVHTDVDGNWIATYELAPQTDAPVYLSAAVRLRLDADASIPVVQPISEHSSKQKYWEVDSSAITTIANTVTSPLDIHKKVIETLEYSYAYLETGEISKRQGAVAALQNPLTAVCQEFTDLFVAIARAKQIPARRLTGYAFTQNTTLRPLSLQSDILHAWPEFFNSTTGRWQQIDPTWEDTTGGIDYFNNFDLNHIVFAINGVVSTTPYPAGSYKSDGFDTKDVEVQFTDSFPIIEPEIVASIKPTTLLGVALPGLHTVTLTNTTGQAWYYSDVRISIGTENVRSLFAPSVSTLLPYQTIEVPLQLATNSWTSVTTTPVQLIVSIADYGTVYESTAELSAGPAFIAQIQDANLVIGVVVGIAITTAGAGSILVFRRSRKGAVRRQSQKSQAPSQFLQLFKKAPQSNQATGQDSDTTQVQDSDK